MEAIVKVWTEEEIRLNISIMETWAIRALLAIYARQTATEKAIGDTTEHNSVGFTGWDAEILTSMAKQYNERGWLTVKQISVVMKRMPKYAGQLLKIIEGKL